MNPTAVDFFCLPLSINMQNPYGTLNQSGLTESRSTIINGSQNRFTQYAPNTITEWKNLQLNFNGSLTQPNQSNVLLRLVSPSIATAPGSSSVNPNQIFPTDYLSNATTYGFNYINSIWTFYAQPGNQLRIDASEIASVFGGQSPTSG